ncbi:hypothetical protein QR680_015571 [Steinernema hermaphroditum]|uniref:Uncharacterized protein n=1 Tax=Steinernema hermaphroditum TaxID=289476 RepID=A0AA39H883_9BILA|nr:hypothetical protein QR680_015571 [Steinernema hermaphroditum]
MKMQAPISDCLLPRPPTWSQSSCSPFNDYQIAMLVFAGVNIFMGPLVFVSVTKGWPTGLRLYSLLTCICMAFAGTALVFTIWSQLDVQSFLASYNWFDATRPEADQELNARFVLAVYSVGIIAYFAFLIFALFVVEQHRKYILAVPNSEEQI